MNMKKYLLGSAIILIAIAASTMGSGCPQQPASLDPLQWSDGLVAIEGACENSYSIEITAPADVEKATFTLLKENSDGEFLATGVEYVTEFGIVENVTLYRLNVDYEFRHNGSMVRAPLYWKYGPYYYYGWSGGYYPVPWAYAVSHNLSTSVESEVHVSEMEIVHGTGANLFALFQNLSSGRYKVKINALTETLRQYDEVRTDTFEVVGCNEPTGCLNPVLDAVYLPFFGQENGATASGTVTCVVDEPLQVAVYYNVNSPDPWYGPYVGAVESDGTWSVAIDARQADAEDFEVALVRPGTVLQNCQQGCHGRPEIPDALSVRYLQRFAQTRLLELTQLGANNWRLRGQTNCDPTLFKLACYLNDDTRWVPQPTPTTGVEPTFEAAADGTFTISLTWPNWTFGHVQNLYDDANVQYCWPPADGLCTGGPLNAFDWVGTPLDFTPVPQKNLKASADGWPRITSQ